MSSEDEDDSNEVKKKKSHNSSLNEVTESQLESLNDADAFGTAWQEILRQSRNNDDSHPNRKIQWGGRGQGGRGRGRRTYQPHNVVVDNLSLEYAGTTMASSKVLLHETQLKLLSPHSSPVDQAREEDTLFLPPNVYALVGRNGSGKSTLLKRMHDGSIPGFPPHISTLYLPQELGMEDNDQTPARFLEQQINQQTKLNSKAREHSIQTLEEEMEELDLSQPEQEEEMERLMDQMAAHQEELDRQNELESRIQDRIRLALEFMGVSDTLMKVPLSLLSPGLCKKVMLASILVCPCDLLLLDEPTSHLDVAGLIQLRRLLMEPTLVGPEEDDITSRASMVLLVSHDLEFVNHMATHIIEVRDQQLFPFKGNYVSYAKQKRQMELHHLRQDLVVEKKKQAIRGTIQHLKEQNPSRRKGGAKKKQRQIESHKKQLDRIDRHHIPSSSPNPIKRTQELLHKTEDGANAPSKEVQFHFRDPKSEWGQPLIVAQEIALALPHTEGASPFHESLEPSVPDGSANAIRKKPGYLFDLVDFCIDEGKRYCILGANGSGKSCLLRLLAKKETPTEGEIAHATNLDVALVHQELADGIIKAGLNNGSMDALSFLSCLYPSKAEQEIRSELTNFGIGPSQATTNLRFLSGGERARVALAAHMLADPQVLLWDNPTLNLDAESVQALIHGLLQWKGTLVVISHDTFFVRSLDPTCFVLMEHEGKLRWVDGSVDTYLRSFAALKRI